MALDTDTVETFPHLAIAGEPVDTEGLPFNENFFRGEVPVALNIMSGASDGVLFSPGEGHGRSYELVLPTAESGEVVEIPWQDRFANPYTVLITKGNNFSKAEVLRHDAAPSGFIPHGLQEGDALLRVLRSSYLLRQAGIDTEWIVRIQEPKQLHYEGEFVPPPEYKRRIISDLLARTALAGAGVKQPDKGRDPLSEEEISEIAKVLQGMDFFITLRAMATPYRITDIVRPGYLNYTALKRVFEDYNAIARFREPDLASIKLPLALNLPEVEDVQDRDTDIEQYFSEVLPKLMALNLARLHNLGLMHDFPHLGNFTGLGGLVDLDSVKGSGLELGDPQVTKKQIARDFWCIFGGGGYKNLEGLMKVVGDYFRSNSWTPMENFCTNFLTTYLQVQNLDPNDKSKEKELVELLAAISDETKWETAREYLRQLTYPVIGQLFEAEVKEIVKTPLILDAKELAAHLFISNIKGHEEEFFEFVSETFPQLKDRLPTLEEIKTGVQNYLGINLDEEKLVRDLEGTVIMSKDLYEEDLVPYLAGERYKVIYNHLDDIGTKLGHILVARPDILAFEELDKETRIILFFVHTKPVTDQVINEFILPNPDVMWEELASLVKLEYIDEDTDEGTIVELYPDRNAMPKPQGI